MKIYRTNYNYFSRFFSSFISTIFTGSWRSKSLGILSLLFGYYLASTLTSYLLVVLEHRFSIVFLLLLFIEIAVRLRNRLIDFESKFVLTIIDNFRIGITYSIVLEAFKLGS